MYSRAWVVAFGLGVQTVGIFSNFLSPYHIYIHNALRYACTFIIFWCGI